MKLTFEQIKAITKGAAYVEEQDGAIHFHRFTKEQEEMYFHHSESFHKKTFCTAGIRLEFATNSTTLGLEVTVFPGSSRVFFNHEIFVNGTRIGLLGSDSTNVGTFSGSYVLGDGEKTVCVYFPWSVGSALLALTLDDGATLHPVSKKRTMLLYGDSITHGYDACDPSHAYATRLTDALEAEARNKAIGGEVFWGALAEVSDEICPDVITVAYGTNDWSKCSKESFETECRTFYEALSRRNPQAKIFAITPIWRADLHRGATKVGLFDDVAAHIRKTTAALPNVTVIDGINLLPHNTGLFSDQYLHPNDEGFGYYFASLYREIQKYL